MCAPRKSELHDRDWMEVSFMSRVMAFQYVGQIISISIRIENGNFTVPMKLCIFHLPPPLKTLLLSWEFTAHCQ